MRRFDVITEIVNQTDDSTLIVCNIGDPCKELHAIKDCDSNFYMLGSLGLASSIGFGLAISLAKERKVVVIDGDGGVLMNLGTLATIGRYQPANLIMVLVDNGAHGSTGDQPTASSTGCNLGDVAQACGIKCVVKVESKESFRTAFKGALEGNSLSLIHTKVSIEKPDTPLVPFTGLEVKQRFMTSLTASD